MSNKNFLHSEKKSYVIQKHDASHLHYDLRLEMEGVLKSWAVPKKPPLKKGVKRLAIQTPDHPLSYADFEGKIPDESYGGGNVSIWDNGSYELEEKNPGKIVVTLHGDKLTGRYCLIKFSDEEKNWLLFKCE